MDYQVDDNRYQDEQMSRPIPSEAKQSPNSMATASLVMGILSLVTCCCYYGTFIFGGLGILFALLSRTEERMCSQAKTGLALSIAGLVLVFVLWGGLLVLGRSVGNTGSGPIQNLPAIPEVTSPGPDNILTILRFLPMGGGVR